MTPNPGDVFLIPTLGGEFVVGQIIAFETRTLHCISCGLFDQRVSNEAAGKTIILDENRLFATLLASHVHLLKKKWPIVQSQPLKVPKKFFPYEKELRKRGIGAKIYSPGNIEDFLNAFYGKKPWDMYLDATFFDKLLLNSSKKPLHIIYKSK